MTDARACDRGHDMILEDRFKFDHEPDDDPRTTDSLERFRQMGVELGAEVAVWYCPACDRMTAVFTYPGQT